MIKDSIDNRIIEFLKKDSRKSFVHIGKKLHLSESAVRRRVKHLMDKGIIKKFTILVEEEISTKAIVLVSVESTVDTSKISSQFTNLNCVETVYEITGQYDITVIMSAPNINEINTSIDALRKTKGVVDTNTVIILKTV